MATGPEPRIQKAGAMTIAGLRRHHQFGAGMSAGLVDQWQRFSPMIHNVPHARGHAAYGICYDMSADRGGFDYLTGVEVTKADDVAEPLVAITVPAKTYAVFAHPGHVSTIRETVQRAWDWLPKSGRRHDCSRASEPTFFERYGERFDPQTGLGDIEIWLPVKAR